VNVVVVAVSLQKIASCNLLLLGGGALYKSTCVAEQEQRRCLVRVTRTPSQPRATQKTRCTMGARAGKSIAEEHYRTTEYITPRTRAGRNAETPKQKQLTHN